MQTLVTTLLALLFVYTVTGQTPIPPFSSHFSASLVRNESYYSPLGVLSTHTILLNLPGKQAYTLVVSSSKDPMVDAGEFWLIFAPPGADPGTIQTKSYVEFSRRNLTNSNGEVVQYCSYSTIPDWNSGIFAPPGKFPPQWNLDRTIQMASWFDYSNEEMVYAGPGVWRSIMVDRWDSKRMCALFGQAAIPCTRLATRQGTGIPVATQFAHEKKPNSFESDWISFDWWTYFNTQTVPPIGLPSSSWTTKCYNAENGFTIDPVRGYVSTPGGMDNFTVILTARPIDTLGPVIVKFQLDNSRGHCVDCVDFAWANGTKVTQLSFTTDNWNQPIRVYLKYLKDGESYFTLVATSGGYDIPYLLSDFQTVPETSTRSSALRSLTCANGVPGWGCNGKKRR